MPKRTPPQRLFNCSVMTSKILPVFISFAGCRQRCIYCNQNGITGLKPEEIIQSAQSQIDQYQKYSEKWEEIAFYGGSFTCLPVEIQLKLYKMADDAGIGVKRFSTGPDCINDENMALAAENGVKTVEIGVQSLDDAVLRANNRPCDAENTVKAVKTAQKHIKTVICQLMAGMYMENFRSFAETIHKVIDIKPQGVRIYPCMVLKDTELDRLYKSGDFLPLPFEESLARSIYGLMMFESNDIDVIRIGLQDGESLKESITAGHYHPAMGDLAKTAVYGMYFESGLLLETDKKYLNTAYGYGGLNRELAEGKVIIKEGAVPNIRHICKSIRENIHEDYKRFIQRKAAFHAERLVGETHNG